MLYSIIIINYKTKQLSANCIRDLLALPNFQKREIIVIDNDSNDGSVESLQSEFGHKIKLISNQENLGFAGANNQGAAIAQGKYLLFLNSDTIIKEDIFSTCLNIFQQHPEIGIISPRLLNTDGNHQTAAYGRFPTLGRLIKQSTKKDPSLDAEKEYSPVDWVSGCALMIRKELFEKIKGWDDNFFLYYEDIDLCCRTKQSGFLTVIANQSKITHLGGQSLNYSLKKRWYYFRSQDYYFKKHYGLLSKKTLQIIRLPYQLLIILRSLKR